MINLNTQAKFTLPPLVNGDKVKLTGEKLFNTREIHGLPDSRYLFSTHEDSNIYVTVGTEYNNERPVYTDTTAKFNGALDGGLAVASLTDTEFGSHSLVKSMIGGEPSNVTPLLNMNMDEVLLPNGDQVYALIGVKTSALSATGIINENTLQLSFVTITGDGVFQPLILPRGNYYYGTNGIYAWATARYRELPVGGSTTISTNVGGVSRGEILDLIKLNLPSVGYLNLVVTEDADIEEDEGYVITYSFKAIGNAAPTVSIVGSESGNSTVPNTITTDGTGILAKSGLAIKSDITAYFNGVTIKPQHVSVTVAGNDVTVVIDNSDKLIADGLLAKEDSYTLVYYVPNEATL